MKVDHEQAGDILAKELPEFRDGEAFDHEAPTEKIELQPTQVLPVDVEGVRAGPTPAAEDLVEGLPEDVGMAETPRARREREDVNVDAKAVDRPAPMPASETEEAPDPRTVSIVGSVPAARRRILQRVKESAALQFGLLCVAGALAVLFLFGVDEPSEPRVPQLDPVPTFPKLEIEGAPRVTEEDIARRLRMLPEKEPKDDVLSVDEVIAEDVPDEVKRRKLKAIAARGRQRALAAAGHREGPVASLAVESRGDGSVDRGEGRTAAARNYAGWFKPGGTIKIEGLEEETEAQRLPLGVGDRMHAKLEVGISSGHSAPVLARLAKDVVSEGRIVAPKGAMLKGRFRADGRRIYVSFDQLILRRGERLRFEGYAVDKKVPGLLATRREIEGGDAGAGVLRESVDVAKEVVGSLASGSIVGRVAQGVAEGALPDVPEGQVENLGFILEVTAGKRFEIVVTGGEG